MADTEDELLWLLLESGRIAIGSKEVHDILRERTYVVTDLQNAAAAGGSK